MVEFSTRVKLKFYYLAEAVEKRRDQPQDQSFKAVTQANIKDYLSGDNQWIDIIKISQLELNFKELVRELPLQNQYDY